MSVGSRIKEHGKRRPLATALVMMLAFSLTVGLLAIPGCLLKKTIDKALVTKRGVEVLNEVNAKAADGYDVRLARAKWTEALQSYTANDFIKTNQLLDETKSLLEKSNEKIAERIYYNSSGGLKVSGLLFKPKGKGPWPLIVVCHAGFGQGSDFSDVALGIRDKGYVVLNPDFRGSGKSEGENEGAKGEVDDVINGIKYVKSLGLVQDNRIGIFGQSHGATIAMLTAARYRPVKAVVEEAGFTDAVDLYNKSLATNDPQMATVKDGLIRMVGGTPKQVPEEYRVRSPINYANEINAPLLLIHGAKDPLIPVEQAQRMYDAMIAAGKTAQLKIYPDEAHCIGSQAGRNEVWEMMFAWFKKYV